MHWDILFCRAQRRVQYEIHILVLYFDGEQNCDVYDMYLFIL